ncbi:MAG TPA: hypothetical protein VEG64_07500 [Candidatus Sulfotelmatobacter sp.]|nr:hypothetical protein [Candidatus Sulfotelmatobacter sp.]
MPSDDEEILNLKRRILELEAENEELKKKLDRARGVPAEVLVAKMTGGTRTGGYKDSHDVTTRKRNRIEVKLSKVHEYTDTKTKRWTWDRILGPKEYDYLVLAGEKDGRWSETYPPDLEYVFFLVPRSAVQDINSRGDCVALNTNLKTARAPKARLLIDRYLVRSEEQFKNL